MPSPFYQPLTRAFLLRIIPVLFLVTLAVMITFSWNEFRQEKALAQSFGQQRADNLARLLAEPVWQLSHSVTENILRSSLDEADIHCVELIHSSGVVVQNPPVSLGSCEHTADRYFLFRSPVIYPSPQGERYIATVTLHQFAPGQSLGANMLGNAKVLLVLLVLLFTSLVVATTLIFRWTILRPLHQVSESLRQYQSSGQRVPVDWSSNDELGLLIDEYNRTIALQVRTEQALSEAKNEAEQALANLKEAQNLLIQSEKLAALGSLVAGIAHEINTPIGNSMTVLTALTLKQQEMAAAIAAGRLKRSTLDGFMAELQEGLQIAESSLAMAIRQIGSFKQVAVDQTSMQHRRFDLKEVIDEVVYTFRPRTKKSSYHIEVAVPPDIIMTSYPGPIGQIIVNAISNAFVHGFEGRDSGCIRISARQENGRVAISVTDDGQGMETEALNKAFDPFYTTKMGQGGSGLGLHIVFNLVKNVLKGSVVVESGSKAGTTLRFTIPQHLQQES
ncbi:sensor histidine kinase [Zobellella sp. DQSA1]|uniref:sensor histidine kinase n=1 Tax=Zobellella sp. DQSA1 TaxID=3342386 RepID=UPI0035BEDB5D